MTSSPTSEPTLSVVIPVYGSEAYLAATVEELLRELSSWRLEIVLVNDASPDGVQAVIEDLSRRHPSVRYLELGGNRGQHAATLAGFAATTGAVVVTADDDGQNPPSALAAIASALLEGGCDVVYGRFRSIRQPLSRRLLSRANLAMSRITMGNRQSIPVTNVRAIRGDLARALGSTDAAYPYIDAMIFRSTRRIQAIEVDHRERAGGRSTYRLRDLIRLWVSHMSTLTTLPLKAATAGCFLLAAMGFLLGGVQLVRALARGSAPAGWLSIFCTMTFLFAMLFAFLGVVSVYVGRMYVASNAAGLRWVRSASPAAPAAGAERSR